MGNITVLYLRYIRRLVKRYRECSGIRIIPKLRIVSSFSIAVFFFSSYAQLSFFFILPFLVEDIDFTLCNKIFVSCLNIRKRERETENKRKRMIY